LLALTEANRWGWGSPNIVGLFAGAAGLLVLWARVERRSAAPMVDVRMLARRPVLVTNLTTFVLGYALFGVWFLVPQLVQAPRGMPARDVPLLGYGLGASVTQSGLYVVSCSLALVTLAPIAGLAAKRWGGQVPLLAGMTVLAAAACCLAAWHATGWQVVVGMFGLGVGIALAFAALPILIIAAAHPSETGVATGINMVMRTIGGVVGGQVGAALLTARTVGADRLPAESAFVIAFTACGVVAAIGAVLCLLLYRRPRHGAHALGGVDPAVSG
jgi:MFS family permease